MAIDPDTLAVAAAELGILDFSAENDLIATRTLDIARMEAALATARERENELTGMLSPRGRRSFEGTPYAGHDGRAVADALLAELSPTDAAAASPTSDELERERNALRAGAQDLQRRIASAQAEIDGIKSASAARVSDILSPLADGLLAEARAAAEQILASWAGLKAIGLASRSAPPALRIAETALREGLIVDNGLLRRGECVPVPVEVAELLRGLLGKGAALPAHVVTTAHP